MMAKAEVWGDFAYSVNPDTTSVTVTGYGGEGGAVDSPAITGVDPSHGSAAGGTSVVITGTGFVAVSAVHFGTTATASFTVDSPTQITATAPAGTIGQTKSITVTTPRATSADTAGDEYPYDKQDQTITFATLPDRTDGDGPFLLTATARSDLAVELEVTSGPALMAGDSLSITGAGTGTVRASQPGNGTYATAPLPSPALRGTKSAAAGTLLPGHERILTFTALKADTSAAPQTFRAVADGRSKTVESNDANNVSSKPYLAGRPDFVVTKIEFSANPVTCGKAFSAYVTVSNQGNATGDAGYLDVWLDRAGAPPAGPTTRGDKYATVGTLKPGQQKTVSLTSLKTSGVSVERTFQAFVDSRGKTAERDEANNSSTQKYTCAAPP